MYKKMTANDIKSYLSCLNELVDQNNNTYHNSINKKCINAGHFVFTEKKLRQILKLLNFELMLELVNIRISLVKVILKISQEKNVLSMLL